MGDVRELRCRGSAVRGPPGRIRWWTRWARDCCSGGWCCPVGCQRCASDNCPWLLTVSLSLTSGESCQLCGSAARRIRASTAIPLSRSARAITGSPATTTAAAARQRRSTHARPCSLPFHLDRRSPRRDNIRRRLVARRSTDDARPTRSR